jgi:putative CRISPR-associated protein (TIGR02619 family)
MTTIITTTGISLYLNTGREHKTAVPTDDQMRQYLRVNPERASAEANSLLQIAQPGDYLAFLHTATAEAERCVRLLKEFFENRGYNHNHIHLVPLQFQEDEQHIETLGLRSLVNTLIEEINKARKHEQDIIINATAGLKIEVGYSTMIGMLYQVPVKYLYEKFDRVVTFNPIALDWDTNIFLSYNSFFKWLGDKERTEEEVDTYLKGIQESDRVKIQALLTPLEVDDKSYIFLSPMGEALQHRFVLESKEAEEVEWPSIVEVKNIKDKIATSIIKRGHDYPRGIESACEKIARIPYVVTIIPGHFETSPRSCVKRAYDNGTIDMLWSENGKAARLTVQTTAQGRPQTLKVANKIREILEIR